MASLRHAAVANMAILSTLLVSLSSSTWISAASAAATSSPALTLGYYNPGPNSPALKWRSCPSVEKVVATIVANVLKEDIAASGPLLRLFFHDCFVQGCDGSILLDPPPRKRNAEKDAGPNLSLDGYDIINHIKAVLEQRCPGVVSCADILALAAREAVHQVGGPFIRVRLGRRDGFGSSARNADLNLPSGSWRVHNLKRNFALHGLNIIDLVALSGAHTIGAGHCDKITERLPPNHDPTLNPKYKAFLAKACRIHRNSPDFDLHDDFFTPNKFDNQYYKNLLHGYGLFTSDAALANDKRTRGIVVAYARNQTSFFRQFALSFQKMGNQRIIYAPHGQIRKFCGRQNPPMH